jgi:hypothetical protein
MRPSYLRQLAVEFQFKNLFPNIIAGLISGILTVIIEISLAALIFSGDLARFCIQRHWNYPVQFICNRHRDCTNEFLARVGGYRTGYTGRHTGSSGSGDFCQPISCGYARSDLYHGGCSYCSHITRSWIGFLLMGIFRLGALIRFIP